MVSIDCPACETPFRAAMFSRAFSGSTELVCSDCGVQAFLSPYGAAHRHVNRLRRGCSVPFELYMKDPEEYRDDPESVIEDHLKPCACGGRFRCVVRRYDLYHCPHCRNLLPAGLIMASLGVHPGDAESGIPFDGEVVIEGEQFNYTHPGLETVGHTTLEPWDETIDDPVFQGALAIDREHSRDCAAREKGTRDTGTRPTRWINPRSGNRRRVPAKLFSYVGPEEILHAAIAKPTGLRIAYRGALLAWLHSPAADAVAEQGWVTYVVDSDGWLLLAHRRSEHVACSAGESVLAAGEIQFNMSGEVLEVTNHSTGYCPSEDCWDQVRMSLEAMGVDVPEQFTFVARFRLCPGCGQKNLVKDDCFFCEACDAELPRTWNFDSPPRRGDLG